MNEAYNIKKTLRVLFRKSYFIIAVVIGFVLFARQVVNYIEPVYESTVKIKLDDIYTGVSNSNLFKDFDVFSSDNKIKNEVELIKSQLLVKKTLAELDFGVSYFRVGKVNTKEIYDESPFIVRNKEFAEELLDHEFNVEILNKCDFRVTGIYNGVEIDQLAKFDSALTKPLHGIIIYRNDSLLAKKKNLNLSDLFKFRINSNAYLISNVVGDNLKVIEIDKDVAVVRLTFRNPVPKKSSYFINKLAQVYVEDYVENKIGVADQTVGFIDKRLGVITDRLKKSEQDIEAFKKKHGVVNLLQETETGLRKISQLKVQLVNLEMEKAALDSLNAYLISDPGKFLEKAPSFEDKGGLLFTEFVKVLRSLEADRKDKLVKYTPDHEMIKNIDRKIKDVSNYIKKDIQHHCEQMHIQKGEIERGILEAEAEFDDLPTTEKNLVVLERDFKINQGTYNFLREKKIEAEIQKASTISFHRIIQESTVPKSPISPNRSFIQILAGFVGFIFSIFFVLVRNYLFTKVQDRFDIEKKSNIDVFGSVGRGKLKGKGVRDILSSLNSKGLLNKKGDVLSFLPIGKLEKGAKVADLAAEQLNKKHKVVLLSESEDALSFDDFMTNASPMGEETFLEINISNLHESISPKEDLKKVLVTLKTTFDKVVVAVPELHKSILAMVCLQLSTVAFVMASVDHTPLKMIPIVDELKEDYKLKKLFFLLTNTGEKLSFDGRSQIPEKNGIVFRVVSFINKILS